MKRYVELGIFNVFVKLVVSGIGGICKLNAEQDNITCVLARSIVISIASKCFDFSRALPVLQSCTEKFQMECDRVHQYSSTATVC